MSIIISDYEAYTPGALRDLLMGAVSVGDADELHSACIALANIATLQASKISGLNRRIAQLEAKLDNRLPKLDDRLNQLEKQKVEL